MRIGILQTGYAAPEVKEEYGDFDALFQALLAEKGFSFASFPVIDMVFPDAPDACDGWIITGSRLGAYEDIPFIPVLEDFIRQAQASNIPVVGICFGHQIMAQALGGKVEKSEKGWILGQQNYTMSNGECLSLNAIHQDQIVTLPMGAEVIGKSETCPYAALLYGQTGLSYQAHPEFTNEVMKKYLHVRGFAEDSGMPRDRVEGALERNGRSIDHEKLATSIAKFFKARKI